MTISVTVTRSALTIKGCPPELAQALAFTRNRIAFRSGDLENVQACISYAQYDAQTKSCRTYPNALHLVQAAALKLGLNLAIQDQRLRPPLDVNTIESADCPREVRRYLDAVTQSASSGLILAPEGSERIAIVCGLVRLLPLHFKILITSDNEIAACRIHESLAQAFAQERIGFHVKPRSARARIMVTHLDALTDFVQGDLAHSGYALRDFDAWVCDEAHRLPEENRIPFINQFRTVYAWGLTATPVRADNSHQLLSVIFGPVLWPHGRETLQLEDYQPTKGATRVFVFPLPTPPIAANLRLHEQVRIAYLKNSALRTTLRGIDGNVPESAKVTVLVDSLRLGIILHKQLPHYLFLDSRQSAEHRRKAFDKLRTGEVHRLMVHLCNDRNDLPQADYVIDCAFASSMIGQHAGRVMLLCLGCERFFDDGIAKLQKMNALEWQVTYMFDRKLVEQLPFARAPLLAELGAFPER